MNFYKNIASFLLTGLLAIANQPALAECLRNLDPVFDQGRDYFLRGQYLLSTQQFTLYTQLSCDSDNQDKGRLRWAQSLYELSETQEGNLILSKINSNSKYFAKSKVVQAWYQPTLVSSLPENDQKRFENWSRQISQLPNHKNPWLSGTMSALIPGLGQVYNGNYQSAVFSFVLNALFLSATVELHNKGMDATALASGALFSVVYVGNIVGTVQSSKAINFEAQADQRSEIKLNLFPELTF